MTHYLVRIPKKTMHRNIDDTTTEQLHECVIEAKSMRAAKLKARKIFQELPIVEEMTERWCRPTNYRWENEYKAAYCRFNYWNDNNEKVTVSIAISPLREYYRFGMGNCSSAAFDLKEALKHLLEEQTFLYTTKPDCVDTHPAHLQAEVEEIKEELLAAQVKLDKLNEKYRHYYEQLGD